MATLTPTVLSRAGVSLAGVSASVAGDTWKNTGSEVLVVANGGVGSVTLTFAVPVLIDGGLAVASRTVAVGAGITMAMGPFPPSIYNSDEGMAVVTYSGVTSVSVRLLQWP